jgi:hypothetical protein
MAEVSRLTKYGSSWLAVLFNCRLSIIETNSMSSKNKVADQLIILPDRVRALISSAWIDYRQANALLHRVADRVPERVRELEQEPAPAGSADKAAQLSNEMLVRCLLDKDDIPLKLVHELARRLGVVIGEYGEITSARCAQGSDSYSHLCSALETALTLIEERKCIALAALDHELEARQNHLLAAWDKREDEFEEHRQSALAALDDELERRCRSDCAFTPGWNPTDMSGAPQILFGAANVSERPTTSASEWLERPDTSPSEWQGSL